MNAEQVIERLIDDEDDVDMRSLSPSFLQVGHWYLWQDGDTRGLDYFQPLRVRGAADKYYEGWWEGVMVSVNTVDKKMVKFPGGVANPDYIHQYAPVDKSPFEQFPDFPVQMDGESPHEG